MSEQLMWGLLLSTAAAAALMCMGMWLHTRKRYKELSEELLDAIQKIEQRQMPEKAHTNEESLRGKILTELEKLAKIYYNAQSTSLSQKKEIQHMVSDISHQLKTPIANIMMYCDMASDGELPAEERNKYLAVMTEQVEKLDFLVRALMKMSRMESTMIVLEQQEESLYQCIAQALSGISRKAEEKQIYVSVICPESVLAVMDKKWTVEAIENVLDNAVKYTAPHGKIQITVTELELFTRIDITDNGIGLEEKHYNDVFKRFWRGKDVHPGEGVGIGLYLTREIITRQGGYMKVKSVLGEGSCFSVYLPRVGRTARRNQIGI